MPVDSLNALKHMPATKNPHRGDAGLLVDTWVLLESGRLAAIPHRLAAIIRSGVAVVAIESAQIHVPTLTRRRHH